MNNMMKVTSVICIKKGGTKYTPCCPCEIAMAIVRPSKYRRKRCRRHGKNMIISTLIGQMQK